jgi:O-methyltransferase involved in polyketide biosynthesis
VPSKSKAHIIQWNGANPGQGLNQKMNILHKVNLTEEKETLLIPLLAKALDSRSKNPILGDKTANELVDSIEYDFHKLRSLGDGSLMVVRARQLDDWINDFIANNDQAIVLNLGCGLDTRVLRINVGPNISWYDLDFPEVIELRKKFFVQRNNYFMIGSSITNPRWLEQIPTDRPAIIVAEGVLEYLAESEVKALFNQLTNHFSQGQVVFDVLSSFAIRQGNSKMRKTTGATLKWAVDDACEIEKLDPKLKRINELPIVGVSYIGKIPWTLRMLYRSINMIRPLKNMLFRLLRYRF